MTRPTDMQLLTAAHILYAEDGSIEIEESAEISPSDEDEGAYVQAWVWVPYEIARANS